MSSDENGVADAQQTHDVALTALAIAGALLTALLLVALFAPPNIGALFEPVTRLFAEDVYGFQVWQLVVVVVLALGTWLLIVDIRAEKE